MSERKICPIAAHNAGAAARCTCAEVEVLPPAPCGPMPSGPVAVPTPRGDRQLRRLQFVEEFIGTLGTCELADSDRLMHYLLRYVLEG